MTRHPQPSDAFLIDVASDGQPFLVDTLTGVGYQVTLLRHDQVPFHPLVEMAVLVVVGSAGGDTNVLITYRHFHHHPPLIIAASDQVRLAAGFEPLPPGPHPLATLPALLRQHRGLPEPAPFAGVGGDDSHSEALVRPEAPLTPAEVATEAPPAEVAEVVAEAPLAPIEVLEVDDGEHLVRPGSEDQPVSEEDSRASWGDQPRQSPFRSPLEEALGTYGKPAASSTVTPDEGAEEERSGPVLWIWLLFLLGVVMLVVFVVGNLIARQDPLAGQTPVATAVPTLPTSLVEATALPLPPEPSIIANTPTPVLPPTPTPVPAMAQIEIAIVAVTPSQPQVGENVNILVQVRNVGTRPINQPFWVDLYVDPDLPPALAVAWPEIAEYGSTWRVDRLAPGEVRDLNTLSADPERSNFLAFSTAQEYEIYALADTFDELSTDPSFDQSDLLPLAMITVNVVENVSTQP
ncbi:hypothetical protein EYB53_003185 [Candidatus Chloroploca sp. M-50]|uniref:DUF11 domain-containing protein n=1 Tax=Candidatus Chloroploca mongolica TaxID=2528176 RepID=A0ABS4D5J8_9CHLR|nr:hypothetical protein [Candidatus Chloroploca mongolica]MBP1464707.1 hypothetical protein [Candidatus Chloroploca mongolica]